MTRWRFPELREAHGGFLLKALTQRVPWLARSPRVYERFWVSGRLGIQPKVPYLDPIKNAE